jgi:VanZ family protein
MIHFSTGIYKKVFYTYVTIILLLLVLPLNGTFQLTDHYFGFRSDHIVHCMIFTPFMTLCYLGRFTTLSRYLLIYGFVLASFCEFLHVFIPYRQASIFDLLANYLGIIISFLCLKLVHRLRLIPLVEA